MSVPRPTTFAAVLLAPMHQPALHAAKSPADARAPLGSAGAPLTCAERIHRPDGRIG